MILQHVLLNAKHKESQKVRNSETDKMQGSYASSWSIFPKTKLFSAMKGAGQTSLSQVLHF
jgi:hypothetical protein